MSQIFICSKFCNSEPDNKELNFDKDKDKRRSTKLAPKSGSINDGTIINISPMKFMSTEKRVDIDKHEEDKLEESTLSSNLGTKKVVKIQHINENKVEQMDRLLSASCIEDSFAQSNENKTGTFPTKESKLSSQSNKNQKYGDLFGDDYKSSEMKRGTKKVKTSQAVASNGIKSQSENLGEMISDISHVVKKIGTITKQNKIEDYSLNNSIIQSGVSSNVKSKNKSNNDEEKYIKGKMEIKAKVKENKSRSLVKAAMERKNDIFSMNEAYNKLSSSKFIQYIT